MGSSESEIEQVISAYAESIQKTIAEEEWDKLNDVLRERQDKLESFFSKLNKDEETSGVKELIKKIQQEDAVFLHQLQTLKKDMKKQYTSFKQGRESVKAYQQL